MGPKTILSVLAVLPVLACSAENEASAAAIAESLEREDRSYLGLDRLEVATLLAERLDGIHRLQVLLAEDGTIDPATSEDLLDRLARLEEGVLAMRLDPPADWELDRNELAGSVRALEEDVIALARDGSKS